MKNKIENKDCTLKKWAPLGLFAFGLGIVATNLYVGIGAGIECISTGLILMAVSGAWVFFRENNQTNSQ